MATTTCKPAAGPVLPLVRTVPENVQSRDSFCLHRLSRRSDSGAPLRYAHDAAAARDDKRRARARLCVAIKRYFVTRALNHSHLNLTLNQHLGVRIPRGAANTILRKSFVKSLNERDVAFVVGP